MPNKPAFASFKHDSKYYELPPNGGSLVGVPLTYDNKISAGMPSSR